MFLTLCIKCKRHQFLATILCHLYLTFSFCLLDFWLRVQTRWIGAYSIFELPPNLFTLLWSIVLTVLITLVPSKKVSKIIYCIVYFLFLIYALIQYGAYTLLGKFLYTSDFLFAGEGADYVSWAIKIFEPSFIFQAFILIAVGIIGMAIISFIFSPRNKTLYIRPIIVIFCVFCMNFVPLLYEDTSDEGNYFTNPALEYQRFINPNFGLELTGLYQFPVRDIQLQISKTSKDCSEEIQTINAFFAEKAEHSANEMTGIFAGKNVIIVMMESLDDWLITPEDTPTIYKMMTQGINFSNMYTPEYSNGYTFNTEFAFNTAVYPFSNGNAAYTLPRNNFDCSIANIFTDAGYIANSFHEGRAEYYNRGQIHVSLGYARYHSYQDYPSIEIDVLDDRFLVASNELYADLIRGNPFFSFVISYSPHLPYTDEEPLAQTALAFYPQYNVPENREVAILQAKARMTDDMFAGLLERLEKDGILEDTVIIGFADHYAYGLSNTELLQQLSEKAGNSILENTPAFIYCASYDKPITVEKVMQITDLAPTIMNLFGLEVPKEMMGQDVFDENYPGFVIFPNGTWLTDTTYIKDGFVQWNNGMTQEEITEMNQYVQQVYWVNDAILDTDYYRYK